MQAPVEVSIKAGQTIVFDGMLVHAGTAGGPGPDGNWLPRYRLHRYIYPSPEKFTDSSESTYSPEQSTYPISILLKGGEINTENFAKKFVLGRPR